MAETDFTAADGKYLGLYLDELESLPKYSEAEILDAKKRATEGDVKKAQEVLLNHYLKDVVGIARTYLQQGLPASDLIGEGNIGLMTAVRSLYTLDSADEADAFVGRLIMEAMERAIYEENDAVIQANEINSDKSEADSEDSGEAKEDQ